MSKLTRTIVKNLLIAGVMGLAAFASWAVTDLSQPTVEISVSSNLG